MAAIPQQNREGRVLAAVIRPFRSLLMLAVVCGVLTLAGQAAACTYTTPLPQLAERADGIDVAFVGRQIDRKVVGTDAVLTFEVDRVYKGEVGPLIEVHTYADGGSCGASFGKRTTAVVAFRLEGDFSKAHGRAGDLSVGIHSDRFSEAEFEDVFGTGYPPDETLTIAEEVARPTSTVPEQSGYPTTSWQLAYVGIALVVLSASLIAIRRRRRQEGL